MVIHIASFPGPFENLVLGMSLIVSRPDCTFSQGKADGAAQRNVLSSVCNLTLQLRGFSTFQKDRDSGLCH